MSTSLSPRHTRKFMKKYDSGMLRTAFVSLFWAYISDRRKRGPFTFQQFAKELNVNKGEVSRWFNGGPNWRLNTIASIAHVLDLEIQITAVERSTGRIFTPAGVQASAPRGTLSKTETRPSPPSSASPPEATTIPATSALSMVL